MIPTIDESHNVGTPGPGVRLIYIRNHIIILCGYIIDISEADLTFLSVSWPNVPFKQNIDENEIKSRMGGFKL